MKSYRSEGPNSNPLMKVKPRISIVVPAYNEEANITHLLKSIYQELMHVVFDFELIIVDDGSADQTAELVRDSQYPVRLVRLSRNFGKENAITAGLDIADGDAVILMDADLQHPISLIHELVAAWNEGYEMVYAVRMQRDDRSQLVQFASKSFYKLLERSAATKIPRGAGDFRLMDRKVISAIRSLPERDRFMKGIFGWVGFRTHAVPFYPPERFAGKSSFNFSSLFALALTGITSFSVLPLRVWAAAGAGISLCSILYGIFLTIRTILFGAEVAGWSTITVSVLFLGGIQLLSIGILGEYVGRIFDEVKRRPNYIVSEDLRVEYSSAKTQDLVR